VGACLLVNPEFEGITPTMFLCGNNDGAQSAVKQILNPLDWKAEDLGTVEAARATAAMRHRLFGQA
jgi:8-hydroxy-5-deazaflavin:NADPH oxidoreductase